MGMTLSAVVVASMIERPRKVDASVSALKMDRWKTKVTTLAASACSAHWECVGSIVPASGIMAWLGHPALDVRIWCDVCLVLGSDIRYPFIKGIGVTTCVVKMVVLGLLM